MTYADTALGFQIRNRIYRVLLCDLKPPQENVTYGDMLRLPRIKHETELSILQTSKEIYREAYGVMIKTNRFVKVTSADCIPIRGTMLGQRTPIVTEIQSRVNQFKGYVLSVRLGLKDPIDMEAVQAESRCPELIEPITVMILHRDLGKVCQGINDLDAHMPGFSESLKISIRMAPVLDSIRDNSISPSFEGFFSQNTQETLLAPLRANLNGYKGVVVKGHVDKSVATAFREDLKKDRYSDPEAVLAQFTAAKQEGSRLFQGRQTTPAWMKWQDAAVEIDSMVKSASWSNLVRRGKQDFVPQLANIYFLMRLNTIQVQLSQWQDDPFMASTLAEDSINYAYKSLKKDYWMKGFKHTASDQHLAKLYFRHATFLRLEGNPRGRQNAMILIDRALAKQPEDPALLREKERIMQWIR